MSRPSPKRTRLSYQFLYIVLSLAIIFLRILPLSTMPSNWAGPDLIFAITFAWVVRRPDYVPMIMVTGVFFLSDILFYRPLGLMTLLVVIAVFWTKVRLEHHGKQIFPIEFISFAGAMVAVHLGYRFILGIFFVNNAPFFLSVTQILSTLALYPLVVAISHYVLRIRPPEPREQDYIKRFV